ncbi:hypothetical protein [Lentisphaera araneosa]|uniref:hypothetical protein n=1 Tax=Lentisphaera araneosa TaxID=256847 RepID=UPI001EE6395D|nr:hypothetical protein [Lentisphaera araneosa]
MAFAAELEFVNKDGTKFNSEGIPALMVTEYLKEQGKLLKDGKLPSSGPLTANARRHGRPVKGPLFAEL